MLTDETWQAIKPVLAAGYPREVVIAVFDDGEWQVLDNVHDDPTAHFVLSDEDHAALMEREPSLLLHSHPVGPDWPGKHDPAEPSDRDTETQIATGWNWGISVVRGDVMGRVLSVSYPEIWGPDTPVLPWEGRSYLWGVRDCWTLVREYLVATGHDLEPTPRVRQPGAHHTDPARVNQFRYWVEKLGFQAVPDRAHRQPGDVAIMCWNRPYPNHCAVYLGEGRYLHQPEGALSSIWQVAHEERMLERFAVSFWRLP